MLVLHFDNEPGRSFYNLKTYKDVRSARRIMEITANLHWIKGLFSNMYLWEDEESLILVDAGRPGDARRIRKYFEEIGRDLSEIDAILITHADYDHAGSVANIQELSGALVFTGEGSAYLLKSGRSPEHMPRGVQFIMNRFIRYRPLPAEAIRVAVTATRLQIRVSGRYWPHLATAQIIIPFSVLFTVFCSLATRLTRVAVVFSVRVAECPLTSRRHGIRQWDCCACIRLFSLAVTAGPCLITMLIS